MNTPIKEPTWQDVKLLDEGTLDTVVSVFGQRIVYEATSEYRPFTDESWKEFAQMVIEDYLNDVVIE